MKNAEFRIKRMALASLLILNSQFIIHNSASGEIGMIHSFSTGEVTGFFAGRTDLKNYYSACRLIENMFVWPHGPLQKRAGTYYIATTLAGAPTTQQIPIEVDLSAYDKHYIAANSELHILDGSFNLDETDDLGGGVAGAMSLSINIDEEVAVGHAGGIRRRTPAGVYDNTYYVPDADWPVVLDVVRGLRYSADGTALYAMVNYIPAATTFTRVYKFDVATGDEIWNNSATEWAWGSFALELDSSDNVYVPKSGGVQQVLGTDGTNGMFYDGPELVEDIWIDESLDMIFAAGSDWEFPVPNRVWQSAAWSFVDGNFLWEKEFENNSLKYIWSVITYEGDIFCAGMRMDLGGGDFGSIFKLDIAGNTVAFYDTGYEISHIWMDNSGQIIANGDPVPFPFDLNIYVFDTDLGLVSKNSYPELAGVFGSEGIMLPYVYHHKITEYETVTTEAVYIEGAAARLIAFAPSTDEDQAYVIEAGAEYMRFLKESLE